MNGTRCCGTRHCIFDQDPGRGRCHWQRFPDLPRHGVVKVRQPSRAPASPLAARVAPRARVCEPRPRSRSARAAGRSGEPFPPQCVGLRSRRPGPRMQRPETRIPHKQAHLGLSPGARWVSASETGASRRRPAMARLCGCRGGRERPQTASPVMAYQYAFPASGLSVVSAHMGAGRKQTMQIPHHLPESSHGDTISEE